MANEATGDTGFDVDAGVNDIAGSLGLGLEKEAEVVAEPVETEVPATETIQTRQPPKSWAKEYHESWGKTDPKVQEYIEKREKDFLDGLEQYKGDSSYAKQLRDILTPYKAVFQAQGVDEFKAVQYLTNAHYRLTNGTADERRAAYEQIGRDLGVVQAQASANIDPVVQKLQNELNQVKYSLTAREQAEQQAARADADREVELFKADASHPYFEDVAQDMVLLINGGANLKDAYEKAVWANPVTRQKELTRIQTEGAAKLKIEAKQAADAARKAASTNIRGTDSRKAPTEPLGSMNDTLHATFKAIKERAH